MEMLVQNISQILGITIIHSLWQGLLVYLVLRLILAVIPSLSAGKRHNLSMAALLCLSFWFAVTLAGEAREINWEAQDTATGIIPYFPKYLDVTQQSYKQYQYALERYLPYIAVVYLAGLLFNTLKLCFAWRSIIQVKRSMVNTTGFEHSLNKFSIALDLSKKVKVCFSSLIDVPGVIGHIKPIILLPISLTTNLSATEVEAILLHELVHIKRNDYLLNLLQQIINVMLFFNPFALLINRHINTERENCCDDEVVAIIGEPLIYARALLKLEQEKSNTLKLALAATGKKYFLLNRIERIMTTKKLTINVRHTLAAVLLFAFSVGSIAWFNPQIKNNQLTITVKQPFINGLLPDTIPAKKQVKKSKTLSKTKKVHTNGQTVTMVEDPELEKLSAEVNKYGDAISNYYNSAEFKKLNEELERKGKEIEAYYDSPEMKTLLEKQEKLSQEMESKWNNNPETEKLSKELEALGKSMESYFNSTQFKTLEKQLETSGAKMEKLRPGTKAYQLEAERLGKLGSQIGKLTASPEIKQKQERMQQLSLSLQKQYQSDEFIKKQDEIRVLSDSVRKAYGSLEMKTVNDAMQQLSQKLQAYQNSPELKKQQQLLQQATAKLQRYLKSDAYQRKLKKALSLQFKADSGGVSNYIDNNIQPEF